MQELEEVSTLLGGGGGGGCCGGGIGVSVGIDGGGWCW